MALRFTLKAFNFGERVSNCGAPARWRRIANGPNVTTLRPAIERMGMHGEACGSFYARQFLGAVRGRHLRAVPWDYLIAGRLDFRDNGAPAVPLSVEVPTNAFAGSVCSCRKRLSSCKQLIP